MSENLRIFTKAVYGFDHVLKLTPERAHSRKSPCDGWNGAELIGHLFGGVKAVQSAATKGKMPTTWPKLGADPMVQWAKLRDGTLEALDHPDVLHTVAETFFGPMPVDAFIGVMSAELAVHTWDLARTAKVDERLDPALCKQAFATWKSFPEPMLRSPNVLGPAIKPAKGADVQTRMLNFLGRAA
jgi:uncharacterized protein (TIGR03086 family)